MTQILKVPHLQSWRISEYTPYTGWPVWSWNRFFWLQFCSCVLVLEDYTEMELVIRCQKNLFQDHTGHPVVTMSGQTTKWQRGWWASEGFESRQNDGDFNPNKGLYARTDTKWLKTSTIPTWKAKFDYNLSKPESSQGCMPPHSHPRGQKDGVWLPFGSVLEIAALPSYLPVWIRSTSPICHPKSCFKRENSPTRYKVNVT